MVLGKSFSRFSGLVSLAILLLVLSVFYMPIKAAKQMQPIDCLTQTSIPVSECEALKTLYISTNDLTTPDPWINGTDWGKELDPCSWFGVTCGPGPGIPPFVVIELDLSSNNLTGSLPGEIGDLTNLTLLDLSDNRLNGLLPNEIGNLTSLQTLNISSNSGLSGPLPADMVYLTVLSSLVYSATDLCEPQEAPFQTWLDGIGSISGSGILCQIDCSDAETSVPQSECEGLFALYNKTDGKSWNNDTDWLYAYDVCSWFGVSCSANHITGLSLPGNNLDGSLPSKIGSFPFMVNLNLRNNSLTGTLPSQLQNLVSLLTLDLSDNKLSGTLPSSMGNLNLLQTLDLANNSFTGQIPGSFDNLTNLEYLDTTDNDLCLPNDASLLSWYDDITTVVDPIINCSILPTASSTNTGASNTLTLTAISLPTNTPTATGTGTITPTSTMLAPHQTLTAMALEETLTATANWLKTPTPNATATRYYILVSQTFMPADQLTKTPQDGSGAISDDGTDQPGAPGQQGISPLWFVLILAIVLIAAGIYLELRSRRKRTGGGEADKEGGFKTYR